MDTSHIAELLSPFLLDAAGRHVVLSETQLQQVSACLDLLLRWNRKLALTSVRDPENIVKRHFGESFFAAVHLLRPASTGSAIDVGSGAGFPGMPLKIYAPRLELTLIESNRKKATFLKEVMRACALPGITVFAGRAEDCAVRAELVTLRAVERFESALPIAARLVAPAGRLCLLIGSPQIEVARRLLARFEWRQPVLIPGSAQRVLLVGNQSS